MNILVLCDDYWHPGKVPREGLERLDGGEFHFEWIEDAREWSAERMANYPVTLLTKSNNVSAADQTPWMAESVQEAFAKYVREGNGLLAVHSGTAEYEHTTILRGVLGGVFTHHPERCPVTVEPLEAGDVMIFNNVGNLASIMVDAAVNGEGVAWIALEV